MSPTVYLTRLTSDRFPFPSESGDGRRASNAIGVDGRALGPITNREGLWGRGAPRGASTIGVGAGH